MIASSFGGMLMMNRHSRRNTLMADDARASKIEIEHENKMICRLRFLSI